MVHLRPEQTETWSTAAKGAQLRARSPLGTWEPEVEPECHRLSAGALLGPPGPGDNRPHSCLVQISTQHVKAQPGRL